MKEVLLFSGGMDSLVAWHYLKKPICHYYPFGHSSSKSHKIVKKMGSKISDLSDKLQYFRGIHMSAFGGDYGLKPQSIYLILIATNFAEKIWFPVCCDEGNEKEIFKSVNQLLPLLYDKKIRVDSPFWNMTKPDLVGWYLKKKLLLDELRMTWSCMGSGEKHCGRCHSCFERWCALEYNGLSDFEEYVVDPWRSEFATLHEMKMERGEYSKRRTDQTMSVLKRFKKL